MTDDINLLPCPFCGGDAEMDTRQGYLALGTGRPGHRIAVYCRSCNADMGVCIEDVPDITPEQVAEMWNRRAAVEADRARPDASARHPDIHDNNSVQAEFADHVVDADKMVPSDAEIVAHLRNVGIVQENLVISRYEMSIARAVIARWGQPAASAEPVTIHSEDLVAVPRDLLGAACSAIDKKRDGQNVLTELRRYTIGDLSAPVAQEHTDSKELKDALNSLSFYKHRCELLQKWQHKMRDPERTLVCDVLANGQLLQDSSGNPDAGRYSIPVAQEPVATLHDDGHYTFKRQPAPQGSDHAGWRMDVFAAPVAAQTQEPVAYLDVGAGGYLDLGAHKKEEELLALPPGRHMLGIIGTYGADGYTVAPVAAQRSAPSIEAAEEIGAHGGPVSEAERLAFEAWMKGHCWALCATWNGKTYIGLGESPGNFDPNAMLTRQLWAAWRDRAALANKGK